MNDENTRATESHDSAASALTAGLGAWLPIETAPRDSKSRLVWVPENACMFCVTWSDWDGDERKPGWMIFGGGWREYLQRATMWAPLPERPSMNEYGEIVAPNVEFRRGEALACNAGLGAERPGDD